jgi:MtN3 and saliva related transmembrane protein
VAETGLAIAAAGWGVVMALSPALQIRRMLQRRSAADVSVGYFITLLVGFVLWVLYGLAARNLALVLPNAIAIGVTVVTIAVALRLEHGGEG